MNTHYIKKILDNIGVTTEEAARRTGKHKETLYQLYRKGTETTNTLEQILTPLGLIWEIGMADPNDTEEMKRLSKYWDKPMTDINKRSYPLQKLKEEMTFAEIAELGECSIFTLMKNIKEDRCKIRTLKKIAAKTDKILLLRYKTIGNDKINIIKIDCNNNESEIHNEDNKTAGTDTEKSR